MKIKKIMKSALIMGAVGLAGLTQVNAQNWTLTPQSNVGFEIKSVGLSVVKGKFNQVQSKMNFDSNASQKASTNFVLDVNSLSFSKPSLKKMIMGEDLFNAAQYKTVSFKSTNFTSLGQGKYNIAGNLTLRGVTKPVVFNTTLKPNASNPKILDVQSSTIINRTDFGMKKAIGGAGEKVNIQLSGQWQAI